MALRTVIDLAQFAFDPTVLNSNLFPVKAIGDVLFLSEISLATFGIFCRQRFIC